MNIETGYAYFVKKPRVIDDLRVLHPASHESIYMVVKKCFVDIAALYRRR